MKITFTIFWVLALIGMNLFYIAFFEEPAKFLAVMTIGATSAYIGYAIAKTWG